MAIVGGGFSATRQQPIPARERIRRFKTPCVFRSLQATGQVDCRTCGSETIKRDQYWCSKHGETCMRTNWGHDVLTCSDCGSYKARESREQPNHHPAENGDSPEEPQNLAGDSHYPE